MNLKRLVCGGSYSLTTEYPATVGNLFLRIHSSLYVNARLNQELNSCGVFCSYSVLCINQYNPLQSPSAVLVKTSRSPLYHENRQLLQFYYQNIMLQHSSRAVFHNSLLFYGMINFAYNF